MTDVVDLDSVRAHLRIPAANTADDALLMTFIRTASEVMRREVGDVIPQMYVETYDGGEPFLFLWHTPVLSIENIQESWGYQNFNLDFQPVNTVPANSLYAYAIENADTGQISRRSGANVLTRFVRGVGNIEVTYTAGRSPIPDVIQFAARELIAFWYRGSQERSLMGGDNPYAFQERESSGNVYSIGNLGVPYRILELIKAEKAMPIIG